MTTPNSMITQALGLIGCRAPGESVGGDEMADCYQAFLRMLDEMSMEGLLKRFEAYESFSIAQGTINYTVTDTAGPVTISSLSVQQNDIRYALERVSPEVFQSLEFPNVSGRPRYFMERWTESGLVVAIYPIPDGAYQATADVQHGLYFSDVNDDVKLPPGYRAMLEFNLAVTLCPLYEREPSANVLNSARSSREKVNRINYQGIRLEPESVVLAR
jgi:hypothetical protein